MSGWGAANKPTHNCSVPPENLGEEVSSTKDRGGDVEDVREDIVKMFEEERYNATE